MRSTSKRFIVEQLESRQLLNAHCSPRIIITPHATTAPTGFTPAQVRSAYNFIGDGTGQTIAIIDAYDNPNLASDLHAFDVRFGLPDPPSFAKVNQNGGSTLPAAASTGGWGVEEALDVEWAHALAPAAKIVIVEANSADTNDLINAAVPTAASLASVVSMSWGTGEFSGETALDSYFQHTGVMFIASTGDSGAPSGYPAYSPYVLAVGGTTLNIDINGNYISESGWSSSGGGVSTMEPQPAYQIGLNYTNRAAPDVAFDADPNSGVSVYDSYDYGSTPWVQVGGTSLGAPSWAAITAIIDQNRAVNGLSTLDSPAIFYQYKNDFHDIQSGNNGYPAGPGYDLVTGIGTPIVSHLVADLIPHRSSVTVTINPYAVTYDTSQHVATGTASFGGTDLSADLTITSTHTNAGTYIDSWVFHDPNGTYNGASGSFTDTIAKANATVTVTGYNVSYDGNPHTATVTATGVGGAPITDYTFSGTTHTLPGTYNDTWTFSDPNYNTKTGNVTDTITGTAPVQPVQFIGGSEVTYSFLGMYYKQVTLNFSGPLNATSAQNMKNYLLTNSKGKAVSIISISYSNNSVTFTTNWYTGGSTLKLTAKLVDANGFPVNFTVTIP